MNPYDTLPPEIANIQPYEKTLNQVTVSRLPCSIPAGATAHTRNCSEADLTQTVTVLQSEHVRHLMAYLNSAGLSSFANVYGFDEIETPEAKKQMGEMFGLARQLLGSHVRTMTCAENVALTAEGIRSLNISDMVVYSRYFDEGNMAHRGPVDIKSLRENGISVWYSVWYYTADSPNHPFPCAA